MADLSNVVRMLIHQLDATRSYLLPSYCDEDEKARAVIAFAESALAAEPPAPAPAADGKRDHVPGAGNMVPAASFAARLRQCPTHGQLPANAWACPECLRELREELARLRGSAADGEREELAQWLEDEAVYYEGLSTEASAKATRAAALLREARPQPVPAWQPIDTAPHDGSEILVSDYDAIEIVSWNWDAWETGSGWIDRNGQRLYPAWWQPLPDHPPIPQPPQGGGGGSVTEHRFQVEFGALAPPIDEQLRDQDLRLDMEEAALWALQCDADGVTRLFVRGILTEAEAHKAKNRILQIIKKHVRPLRPTHPTPKEPPTND